MNHSIWIRPGITENSIQMVSTPRINKDSFHLFHSAATTVRSQLQDYQPLLRAWRYHTCLSMLVYPPFRVPQSILEIGTSRYPSALSRSQLPSLQRGRTLMYARSYMSIWPVSVQSSSRQVHHHPQELIWEQLPSSKDPPTCMTLSNDALITWRAPMMLRTVYVSYSFLYECLM